MTQFLKSVLRYAIPTVLVTSFVILPVQISPSKADRFWGNDRSLSKTISVKDLSKPYEDYQPITQELIDLLANHPDIKANLDRSLKMAAVENSDRKTNPAQYMSAYFAYVDEAAKMLPQQILNNPPDLIRDQILQTICYFHFLVSQPLGPIPEGQFGSSLQYNPVFAAWMRDFANAWGAYLDTPESFTDVTYKQFYDDPKFRLAIGDYEPRPNWNTFNRFFSRYLASPDKRPIASASDTSIVVTPADSQPQGVWNINAAGNIVVEDSSEGLRVKNTRYFNVSDLLGGALNEKYNKHFVGGVLTHTFLNVFDYHRYHFPVGGKILDTSIIQQNVALEVSWDTAKKVYVPIDSTGWQFTQTRGIVIVDMGEKYGYAALIPMGMAQVSSVNFESNVVPGNTVKKGDMLGNFLFGGSDYLMLFGNKANFTLQAKPGDQSTNKSVHRLPQTSDQPTYAHTLMGTLYGKFEPETKR